MDRLLVLLTGQPRVVLFGTTLADQSPHSAPIWGPALLCVRSCEQQRWDLGLRGTWG
ncbi:hypothetical protein LINPERPRIM_LOCUS17961 [Linum perenne]